MRLLTRLQAELKRLPPVVAWLADGPERSKCAVVAAKRKLILIQAPIAFGSIAAFSALYSLGLVEAKGHMKLITHFCATAALMWPPTLFSVCRAAKRDIPDSSQQLKRKLRALAIASGAISTLATITLIGVAAVYVHTVFYS